MREKHFVCEVVSRSILPIFRSSVAKELVENYNFTQSKVAEKLGTTQPAISQYLHSKRGYKDIKHSNELLVLIHSAANETAKGIASGKINAEELMSNFCELCTLLREKGSIT